MSGKAEELRLDRERTLGLLYEMEMKQLPADEILSDLAVRVEDSIANVVKGVDASTSQLDELIAGQSSGWDLERMASIDRCVLRYATWELLNRSDLSIAVVINEAVDLAKRFSTDDSGRFVNGVLDAIAQKVRT